MSPNFLTSYPDLFKMQPCMWLIYCRCSFSTASFFTLIESHPVKLVCYCLLLFAVCRLLRPLLLNTEPSHWSAEDKWFFMIYSLDANLKNSHLEAVSAKTFYNAFACFLLPGYVRAGPHRSVLLQADLSSVLVIYSAFFPHFNMWFWV